MVIFPARNEPDYRFRLALEGVPYRFRKIWNARAGHWVLDIYTDAREAIVLGIKLVVDYPLLSIYGDTRLPPGELLALDPRGNRVARPGRSDFTSGAVLLAYLPSQ